MVDRDGNVLLDTLVRPSDLIPSDATGIHGIDDPAVADAPTWENVYPLVGRILDRYSPVVVYNAEFDSRLLNQVNRRHGLPEFQAEWHCAMKQFAAYAGIWHPRHETWRWHKLTEALRMVGSPAPMVAHRALSDAEACRQIVQAMATGTAALQSAIVQSGDQGDRPRDEPLTPEVIRPGEERYREDQGWTERSGTFPGGQYTVISTRTTGCSTGALILVLFLGVVFIGLGCCAFFYFAMMLA